jgi:tetratricopeptide (TPR) repeat protein
MLVRTMVFIVLLSPATVLGQEPLHQAQEKFEQLDFDGALAASDLALQSSSDSPADLVEAYRIRGLCLSAMGRNDDALLAFRKLLSINPNFKISADTSPKLAAPFYQALAISRELKPISLVPLATKADDQSLPRVRVKLEADPLRLVGAIRVCFRIGSGDWQKSEPLPVSEPGEFSLPLPATAAQGKVGYYFEALTAKGGVLARAGNKKFPLGSGSAELAAVKPPAEVVGAAGEQPLGHEPEQSGPAWYQSWWFWTAVGVVVAGTAVGVGVGLSSGSSNDPVDYNVSVE